MAEIKGPGSRDWLLENGFVVGDKIDRAYMQDDGTLVGMLSADNILFLHEDKDNTAANDRLPMFGSGQTPREGVYPLPRSQGSYWFRLSGAPAAEMMSKLCSVDLRPHKFSNLQIAKTSMVGTTVFIIRRDYDGMLAYHLIGDLSYTSYLWPVFSEAMREWARLLAWSVLFRAAMRISNIRDNPNTARIVPGE